MTCGRCRFAGPELRLCAFSTPRADLSRRDFCPTNKNCVTLLALRRLMIVKHPIAGDACLGTLIHGDTAIHLVWRDQETFIKAYVADERMDPLAVPLTLSFAERVLSERSAA